jgi:uncharacterized membrane protein YecN with MAPEG domain
VVASIYASILALLFVALSIRTIRLRQKLQIGVGDGGNELMLRAMRVHSNFAEYVPLCLLLIYIVESSGANPLFVHLLGVILIIGRFSHAYGVSKQKENYRYRVFGMSMTFTTLIVSSLSLIYYYLTG